MIDEKTPPLTDREIERWRACQTRTCSHNALHTPAYGDSRALVTIVALKNDLAREQELRQKAEDALATSESERTKLWGKLSRILLQTYRGAE